MVLPKRLAATPRARPRCRRSKQVAAVKRAAHFAQHQLGIFDYPNLVRSSLVHQSEHAIVRTDESMPARLHQNGLPGCPHPGSTTTTWMVPLGNHRHACAIVNCGLTDIECANLMSDIHDPRPRGNPENHALHRAHKIIRGAEIGGECNQHVLLELY